MPRNERTLQMMKAYMELRRQGFSHHEIADQFHLSPATVFRCLQEIADMEGVPRDSLLDDPNKGNHFCYNPKPVTPVDVSGFRHHYEAISTEIVSLREEVSKSIEELETMGQLLNEEE